MLSRMKLMPSCFLAVGVRAHQASRTTATTAHQEVHNLSGR